MPVHKIRLYEHAPGLSDMIGLSEGLVDLPGSAGFAEVMNEHGLFYRDINDEIGEHPELSDPALPHSAKSAASISMRFIEVVPPLRDRANEFLMRMVGCAVQFAEPDILRTQNRGVVGIDKRPGAVLPGYPDGALAAAVFSEVDLGTADQDTAVSVKLPLGLSD